MNHIRKFQETPKTIYPLTDADFQDNRETAVYWLSSAGVFINCHGTTIMVDPNIALMSENPPISEVQGMEQLTMPPIMGTAVRKLDAVLITHADLDHLGIKSVINLLPSGCIFHGTNYVCNDLVRLGVPSNRVCKHPPKDRFKIGCVEVQMTAAYHPWQQDQQEFNNYLYKLEDCTGYKFYTPDGVVWDPGDSLLLDEHFDNKDVDLMFIDFGDDSHDPVSTYHFGRPQAIRLADSMPDTDLIMFHWGTFYAPDYSWCNCNPEDVKPLLAHPERFLDYCPGQKYILKSRKSNSI